VPSASSQIEKTVDEAVRQVSGVVAVLTRVGYAVRGIIYGSVGVLAAMGAVGAGRDVRGSEGAFEVVVQQPLGKIVLIAAVVGFLGFAVSYLILTLTTRCRHSAGKNFAIRAGYLISAAIYLGLVVSAIQILIRGAHGNATRESSEWIMSHPLGRWILACIGLGTIGFGTFELWRGIFASLQKRLNLRQVSKWMRQTLAILGRIGVIARGLVFILIGVFFLLAAWNKNARETRTLGGALRFIERQPYGPALLAIVAAGLIAYGLFELAESRYRRLDAMR
jgi:hypothetical protein